MCKREWEVVTHYIYRSGNGDLRKVIVYRYLLLRRRHEEYNIFISSLSVTLYGLLAKKLTK